MKTRRETRVKATPCDLCPPFPLQVQLYCVTGVLDMPYKKSICIYIGFLKFARGIHKEVL